MRGGGGRDTVTFDSGFQADGARVDVAAATTTWFDGLAAPVTFAGFERHGARAGAATVLGGPAPDDLFGTACDLTMRGGAGRDVLRALDPLLSGTRVCPGSTLRELEGGGDGDRLIGSRQAERFFGGGGGDTVYAGPGADRVLGDGGNDLLNGGVGDDDLFGGAGRDTAIGAPGRDLCRAETRRQCER